MTEQFMGRKAMRKLALVVAGSAALVVGCSMLGKAAFQQPVVELKDVRIRGLGLTGGTIDVLLSVYNPNHYRLDATHMTYKVALEGDSVTLASGEVDNKFTVMDTKTDTVTIPVSFTYVALGAAGRSILNTGAVSYHVLGQVTVGTTVGSFNVPYSTHGRFTTTGLAR
jgi:LEA14-like dessication related protein